MKKKINEYHDYDQRFIKRGSERATAYGIELEYHNLYQNVDRPYYRDYFDNNDVCYNCGYDYAECECENREEYERGRTIDIADPLNIFIATTDSSLDDGLELVSQPLTLTEWKKASESIQATFNSVMENSGETGNNTGFHIHIERKDFNELSVRRFIYLIEKFKNELTIFSKRTQSEINEWSRFHDRSDTPTTWDFIKERDFDNFTSSRYRAVNVQNDKTIEVRLFQSTLDITYLYASLELIDKITKIALSDCDIEKITFNQLIKGKHLTAIIEKMDITHQLQEMEYIRIVKANLFANSALVIYNSIDNALHKAFYDSENPVERLDLKIKKETLAIIRNQLFYCEKTDPTKIYLEQLEKHLLNLPLEIVFEALTQLNELKGELKKCV